MPSFVLILPLGLAKLQRFCHQFLSSLLSSLTLLSPVKLLKKKKIHRSCSVVKGTLTCLHIASWSYASHSSPILNELQPVGENYTDIPENYANEFSSVNNITGSPGVEPSGEENNTGFTIFRYLEPVQQNPPHH